jgi:neutral ceramidase
MKNATFHAGAAMVKTTPPLGTRINGDFITHYANFIHDDLYSRALVLQKAQTRIALVVVDICVMPKDFLDEVKAMIADKTGISAQHVLISGTHTHAAGSVADVHLGSVDLAYREKLPGLILKSVRLAIENLKPAQVAYGAVDVPEHLLCRRYFMQEAYEPFNPVTRGADLIKTNPFGAEQFIDRSVAPVDPQLSYMAVKGLDNSWISLLGNYSLHYAGDWENGTISADYFGVFAEEISRLLDAGDGFVGMMSNGTSGDVNIWDFQDTDRYPKENFAKSKLIGEELALRIFRSLEGISWQTDPELSAIYEDLEIETVKPTEGELELARKVVSLADYENIVINQKGLEQLYAREQILLNEFDDSRTCPVQVFKIGTGMIGGLAGEFFSETGLYLKAEVETAFYFTISMANGNVGYVPPLEEIHRGGYETWRCRYSCLIHGAEKIIREKLLDLTRRL